MPLDVPPESVVEQPPASIEARINNIAAIS
jgi:hypothetical protein